jgi:sarcosine oxidase subunit delta
VIRITCPICGLRNEVEFAYYGDASVTRPAEDCTDLAVWADYVFLRENPRGWHREYWQHVRGCREWLVIERNTLTHETRDARLAREDGK